MLIGPAQGLEWLARRRDDAAATGSRRAMRGSRVAGDPAKVLMNGLAIRADGSLWQQVDFGRSGVDTRHGERPA